MQGDLKLRVVAAKLKRLLEAVEHEWGNFNADFHCP